MTTTQTTTPVSQPVENLVESVITLGTSLVRLGASAIMLPVAILPARTRESTVQTAHEVLASVEKINGSILKTVGRVSTVWLREIDTAISAATPPPAAAAIEATAETK